jgi:hypothetical protein
MSKQRVWQQRFIHEFCTNTFTINLKSLNLISSNALREMSHCGKLRNERGCEFSCSRSGEFEDSVLVRYDPVH